jgi:hypothetical protein
MADKPKCPLVTAWPNNLKNFYDDGAEQTGLKANVTEAILEILLGRLQPNHLPSALPKLNVAFLSQLLGELDGLFIVRAF